MENAPTALAKLWQKEVPLSLPNGAELVDPDDFEDIMDQLSEFEWSMPRMPVVAVDGGLGYFLLDTDGDMGEGRGSVWWVERSDLSTDTAFQAADSLQAFVEDKEPDDRWAPA